MFPVLPGDVGVFHVCACGNKNSFFSCILSIDFYALLIDEKPSSLNIRE